MDYLLTVESQDFKDKLKYLNNTLSNSLTSKGYESVLIGNMFYDHLEVEFQNNNMNSILEEKRKRLYDLSKKCSNVFEVGVNGGHSAFLMLYANDKLKYIGNDIASFFSPEPRCHPEVYVPIAFDCLKNIFKERVETIKGDCLIELQKYSKLNNTKHIDLLHLDGDKETYEIDFFTMLPLMKDSGYVVFDDTQQPKVQSLVDLLLSKNIVERCEFPKMSSTLTYRHEIVRIVNNIPSFNVLIASIGRDTLQRMLNSLSPMLEERDCLTVVFDGHSEIPIFNFEQFKCKVVCYFEEVPLGFWGHGIRNKYANLLEPRDFILHADDDDVYIEGSFNKLRTLCSDRSILYIGQMYNGSIIPNPQYLTVNVGNIGTPCGIIPFELNKKSDWILEYGGDGLFYIQLVKLSEPVFLNILIYSVRDYIVQ